MLRAALVLVAMLASAPALAVLPDEILDDPVLEARARAISKGIRCLVCQNEAIDASNADLARDLRLLIRERLTLGDTDDEVHAYLVARYGEFVLLKPRFSAANAALWLSGPALLILGGIAAAVYVRRRRPRQQDPGAPLSAEEEARLARILDQDG